MHRSKVRKRRGSWERIFIRGGRAASRVYSRYLPGGFRGERKGLGI